MNTFNIENYYIADESNIDVSFLPMLVRRKLSKIDKIAFSVLSNIYQNDVSNIIFSSQNGEFERLKEIINQYQMDGMVSPIKFSGSVHNYAVAAFSQLNKITTSYNALSAGEESFAAAITAAIIQPDTKICICYTDNIGLGVIISTKENGYTFTKKETCFENVDNFIKFLNNEKNSWNLGYGEISRV